MNTRFQNKVAVITGAAQGIGRRVAERFVEEGGRLVAVDRSNWSMNWPINWGMAPRY